MTKTGTMACQRTPCTHRTLRQRLGYKAFALSERLEINAYDRRLSDHLWVRRHRFTTRAMLRTARTFDAAYALLTGDPRWFR